MAVGDVSASKAALNAAAMAGLPARLGGICGGGRPSVRPEPCHAATEHVCPTFCKANRPSPVAEG